MLTKQGVSLWSSEPPRDAFHFGDVSDDTARESPSVEVVEEARGDATIVSYTVVYPGEAGVLVALVEMDAGPRTIVATADPDLVSRAVSEELCGARAVVESPESLRVS